MLKGEKHMKKLWKKWFGKSYPTNNKFELLMIDDTAEGMYQKLGITEERSEELVDVMKKAYNNNDKKIGAMQDMLAECTHINEVVVILMFFDNYCDLQNNNPLEGILGAILSSRNK
jgi:hypothetical protein